MNKTIMFSGILRYSICLFPTLFKHYIRRVIMQIRVYFCDESLLIDLSGVDGLLGKFQLLFITTVSFTYKFVIL